MGTVAIESLDGKIDKTKARLTYAIYTDSMMFDDGEMSLSIDMNGETVLSTSIFFRDFDERWIERFWGHYQENRVFRDQANTFFKQCDLEQCLKSGSPSIPSLPATRSVVESTKMSKAIKDLIAKSKKGKAKFKDFAALRSGRDRFSSMKADMLMEYLSLECVPNDIMALDDVNQQKVLRWMARGLPQDMAIRKVKTDLEIAENAHKKKR